MRHSPGQSSKTHMKYIGICGSLKLVPLLNCPLIPSHVSTLLIPFQVFINTTLHTHTIKSNSTLQVRVASPLVDLLHYSNIYIYFMGSP